MTQRQENIQLIETDSANLKMKLASTGRRAEVRVLKYVELKPHIPSLRRPDVRSVGESQKHYA